MTQSFRNSLRGCYEIPLFLTQGIQRFDNSSAAFLQSLLIPLILIPLQIPYAVADPVLSNYPPVALIVALSYRVIVATAFFLGVTAGLAWLMSRTDKFYRFATACNWTGLTSYFLLLPYILLLRGHVFSADQLADFLFFLTGFMVAITAFIARRALEVHWVIAIIIGIAALIFDFIAALMIDPSIP